MGFRKMKGARLFNGWELSDEELVLITDESGTIHEILPASEAGDEIEEYEGILSPGFVNCHCHLELSHLRGQLPPHTGLVDFVLNVVQLRHAPDEVVLEAIHAAESEMLAAGIVAVGDICNNISSLSQKTKGRMYYHNFVEVSGFDPAIAESRFRQSVELFRAFARYYSIPIGSNSIVPHAPYSVSDELWKRIINFPGNRLLCVHNQESFEEDRWFREKSGNFSELFARMQLDANFFSATGTSSLQSFLPKFKRNQSVILVHNVYTTEEDLRAAGEQTGLQLFWCLCPNANMYIENRLPDIDLFRRSGCSLVFGTDSLASNTQLSILEEIRTIQQHFPHIPAAELLKWGTVNGAHALHLDAILGSFEPGKRPGVLHIAPDLSSCRRLI
ncbi:MAG TPA: amidohydrolase family protein [Chitinophagaceae bacterium]|nr:amidohydrolase family protein [Chitinophagaceae bacterium]